MGSSKPYVSIVFFNPFMHRSSRISNIDLATLAGNLVNYSVLFCRITKEQPQKNLRLKLNLLRCYHTSTGYQRPFPVAYNSRAYGQFLDLTQHLDHTWCDLRTLSILLLRNQSTPSPDKDQQYSGRNVAIHSYVTQS